MNWKDLELMREAAVGTKMPDWVQTGFFWVSPTSFPKDMPFKLIEIPSRKTRQERGPKRILDKRGEQMLVAAGKNRMITLDIPGKPWDTPARRVNWNAGNWTVVTSVCNWPAGRSLSCL